MADLGDELLLPPCKVCGGRSSGRHFGIIACEACKSFFKRNKKRDKPYRCRGDTKGECIVKVGLDHPICPYCRYQACIKAGMSRDGINKGRCSIELKAELLLQAQLYQAQERKEKEKEVGSTHKEIGAEGNDNRETASEESKRTYGTGSRKKGTGAERKNNHGTTSEENKCSQGTGSRKKGTRAERKDNRGTTSEENKCSDGTGGRQKGTGAQSKDNRESTSEENQCTHETGTMQKEKATEGEHEHEVTYEESQCTKVTNKPEMQEYIESQYEANVDYEPNFLDETNINGFGQSLNIVDNMQFENATHDLDFPQNIVEDPYFHPEVEMDPLPHGKFLSLLEDTIMPPSGEICNNFSRDEILYPETSLYSIPETSPQHDCILPGPGFSRDETLYPETSLHSTPEASPPHDYILPGAGFSSDKILHPETSLHSAPVESPPSDYISPGVACRESLARTLIDVDEAYSLYDPEELVDIQNKIEHYVKTREAKEELIGKLQPLPHEVYTEVFKSTGIDIDDYRKKLFACLVDIRPDVDIFLDYIRNLPFYKDLNLNDRTLLVKGGFAGWCVLSSVNNYNTEFDIWACNSDMIYNTNDFINYYGYMYSQSIRNCLTLLLQVKITTAELAVLKAMHIFKTRPQVGQIEDVTTMDELQKVLHETLQYVLERDRGPEQGKMVLAELMELFPQLDSMTVSFLDNVKNWPIKFPEYSYPRILLEMVGTEAEEELLVAVSVQLNIND